MDSDPLVCSTRPDDFTSLISDAISGIRYRLMIILFMIFIILTSNIFTTRVLSKINGAVDMKQPTNYGVVLQGVFLVLFFTIIDALDRQDII